MEKLANNLNSLASQLLGFSEAGVFLFIFLTQISQSYCQGSDQLGNHVINTGTGLILNGKAAAVDISYEYIGIAKGKSALSLGTGIGIGSRINANYGVFYLYSIGVGFNYKTKANRMLSFDFINLLSDESGYTPEIDLSYCFINLSNRRRVKLTANVIFARELRQASLTGASLTPIRPLFGIGVKLGRYFGR